MRDFVFFGSLRSGLKVVYDTKETAVTTAIPTAIDIESAATIQVYYSRYLTRYTVKYWCYKRVIIILIEKT